MKPRQVLPYAAGLFLLAWALGSLARSGPGQKGLLLNSFWLLYLVYLLPVFALGAVLVLIVFIALNWRELSDALGFGLAARRRRDRKKPMILRLVVWAAAWGVALLTLYAKCGGILCKTNSTQTLTGTLTQQIVSGSPSPDVPRLGGQLAGLTSIVGTQWFFWAFLGLLAVSSVIIARSVKVSLDETRNERLLEVARAQEEGAVAVGDALRILEETGEADPRTRILASYQRMIRGAANLGAPVGPYETARELEAGIRGMFMLKGPGIGELTRLFEEARYSLHTITEEDSEKAHGCLMEVAEELRVAASVQA